MLVIDIALILGPPNSPPIKLMLSQIGLMDFRSYQNNHTESHVASSRSKNYLVGSSSASSFGVGDGDGKVVLVLEPPTFTYRNFIVGLMVEIFFHLRVLII